MDGSDPNLASASETTDSVRFGHFRVARRSDGSLEELGRGAMGVTYKAVDDGLRITVALKVIASDYVNDELARRRFQREARAAAQLRHPNVASVLHLGEEGGEFFYAMEFVVGRPLSAMLRETPVLEPRLALALMAQVAAALAAAHKRELIHRDLKPANLMLLEGEAIDHEDERSKAAGDRQVKVIDFGLARSFGQTRLEDTLASLTTASTSFTGTPAYASPEQCAGDRDLDGRSDLYSLGIILWQILTGRLPFTGTLSQVIGKHQFQAPPFEELARQPREIVELLRGLLEKDPEHRTPARAADLRDELDRIRRDLEVRAGLPQPPPLPPSPASEGPATTLILPAGARPATVSGAAVPVTSATAAARMPPGHAPVGEEGQTLILPADAASAAAGAPPTLPGVPRPATDTSVRPPSGPPPAAADPSFPTKPPDINWTGELQRLVDLLRTLPNKVWILIFVVWIVFWTQSGNRSERSDRAARKAAEREARRIVEAALRATPTPTPESPTPTPAPTLLPPLPAIPAPDAPPPPTPPADR
ncbi:MAG: serine/threonine protein kinase [Verrucomicrobia bacterium]|nr:serine/threonine protein kinase [Verrucomicrobiota bacterium]